MIEIPRGVNAKSHLVAAPSLWNRNSGCSRSMRSMCILSVTLTLWACAHTRLSPRTSNTPTVSTTLVSLRTSRSPLATRQTLQQIAQQIAQNAVDLLEAGHEQQARVGLRRSLLLDPHNKLALSLKRQMRQDPVATLGRKSFLYEVRAGDTLSRIAGRFMGDIYAFHILARYNSIKVPKLVSEGQIIRVPGKAPARAATARAPTPPAARMPARSKIKPVATPPSPPASEAESGILLAQEAINSADAAASAGQIDTALAHYKRAENLGHPEAAIKAQTAIKYLVEFHSRAARASMARQDLEGAIRSWDQVLELDPGQETAQLERQKALRLAEKIRSL